MTLALAIVFVVCHHFAEIAKPGFEMVLAHLAVGLSITPVILGDAHDADK